MDFGNRSERDPRSGTQRAQDDIGVPGTGMGNPASGQGQFEQRQDYTDRSGDRYAQQPQTGYAMADDRYAGQPQTGYAMADTAALDRGQQRSDDWGQGRAGADQYGSTDPSAGRTWQGDRDDDDTGGFTSKVKGTAEKLAGKMTGDTGKQARGQERKEGTY